MMTKHFPTLDHSAIVETGEALHAYARVLGEWLKRCRLERKHWWHASLRPSLNGLTTGVVRAGVDFQLELNLRESLLHGRTSTGRQFTEQLHGQPACELADSIEDFLVANGYDRQLLPEKNGSNETTTAYPGYLAEHAHSIGRVLNSVVTAMEIFRAGIREETSPIQLWPHHFDLSLLWLPADTIPDQDPANEEYADKQMNFGFTLGDAGIPEPYFYITAYPLPEALPRTRLPPGTAWHSEGFSGAVLLYQSLLENSDANAYLLELWHGLLSAGRQHLLVNSTEGAMQ